MDSEYQVPVNVLWSTKYTNRFSGEDLQMSTAPVLDDDFFDDDSSSSSQIGPDVVVMFVGQQLQNSSEATWKFEFTESLTHDEILAIKFIFNGTDKMTHRIDVDKLEDSS
ncbi:Mitochondrial distribution and morphology protein 12, partial [Ascosphaera pollenicola]